MKELSKYKKSKVLKKNMVTRSVTILEKHQQFIDKESLNFSSLVRDFLDDLIVKQGKK
jgi:peroxiredoxin